ncbi:hypothetical protein F4808DRAFT_289820 [Astrocystis sublimbata]|nr:hypothetical protein F4808DRAFT_289820 [Astrocystis sublimbata]
MRFSIFAAGLFAAVASAQTSSPVETGSATVTSAATSVSIDPAQSSAASELQMCLAACDPKDVNCRAKCVNVPSPDNTNVNATQACVTDCPKGNGTKADNDKYQDCVADCINKFYFTTTGGSSPNTPATTSGSDSDSDSTSSSVKVTQVPTTITSNGMTITTSIASTATVDSSDASSDSADATTTNSDNGAAVYGPVGTGFTLFGLLAGLLAL